jgi:hypothetical protein
LSRVFEAVENEAVEHEAVEHEAVEYEAVEHEVHNNKQLKLRSTLILTARDHKAKEAGREVVVAAAAAAVEEL